MDSTLILITAILGGCGIAIMVSIVIMFITARGMARNSRFEDDLLKHRLRALNSKRAVPSGETEGRDALD